jgi:hypothetical protein
MIEGRTRAEQARCADATEARLKADTSTKSCRNADAAAGVAARGCDAQSGGDGSRRSAARSARNAISIDGVSRRPEDRIDRRHSPAKLVRVRFTEHHRSRAREL